MYGTFLHFSGSGGNVTGNNKISSILSFPMSLAGKEPFLCFDLGVNPSTFWLSSAPGFQPLPVTLVAISLSPTLTWELASLAPLVTPQPTLFCEAVSVPLPVSSSLSSALVLIPEPCRRPCHSVASSDSAHGKLLSIARLKLEVSPSENLPLLSKSPVIVDRALRLSSPNVLSGR